MAKPSEQTAIRLTGELLARIDRLAENLSTEWNAVSRSDAIRAAILRGLPSLEEEAERVKAARVAPAKGKAGSSAVSATKEGAGLNKLHFVEL